MESEIRNTLTTYFGTYGLIIFNKVNEYYKVPLPQKEVIKNIYESLDTNPQYENFPNKINYIACCLYLLSRRDESYKSLFMHKVISRLIIKKDPTDDIHLAQIYNCIDFDENFLHSDPNKLSYLSKYLQKFSEYKKEESISLLFKYYNAILNYRSGKLQEASNECLGIIAKINITNSDKIINFIRLKAQIFLAKICEENTNQEGIGNLQENANLLKDIYLKTINENPFLTLKIGFYIFNNSYNRNQYEECIDILDQMIKILKDFERQGVPPKKMSRFYLSIFCRYGIIGLISFNRNHISMALEGMKMQLLLLQNNLSSKKVRNIFKAYNFSLNILKLNSGLYIEKPRDIGEIFIKDILKPNPANNANNSNVKNANNSNANNKDDNFCINQVVKEQTIINYNSMNSNMNVNINEQAYKIIEDYLIKINKPEKNFISNDTIFTFVIGIHDRVRYLIEQFLTDKNTKNETGYKNQIISNCEVFWNFLNTYLEKLPLLRCNFMKGIIIKMFSSCSHIYFINKDFNKINQIISYFDKLSNSLNINETTPFYELVLKVKGDLFFYQNDYNNSISFYSKSAQIMSDKNPKKAIVYFNLGVLYYYNNDKIRSIENLQRAAAYFKKSEEEKYSFEFHKRNNMLTKKFNLTNALINKIQTN